MNGLNTHIYDEKTKNIESNNNFDIKENKGPSEEEKREIAERATKEQIDQKKKQNHKITDLIYKLYMDKEINQLISQNIKNADFRKRISPLNSENISETTFKNALKKLLNADISISKEDRVRLFRETITYYSTPTNIENPLCHSTSSYTLRKGLEDGFKGGHAKEGGEGSLTYKEGNNVQQELSITHLDRASAETFQQMFARTNGLSEISGLQIDSEKITNKSLAENFIEELNTNLTESQLKGLATKRINSVIKSKKEEKEKYGNNRVDDWSWVLKLSPELKPINEEQVSTDILEKMYGESAKQKFVKEFQNRKPGKNDYVFEKVLPSIKDEKLKKELYEEATAPFACFITFEGKGKEENLFSVRNKEQPTHIPFEDFYNSVLYGNDIKEIRVPEIHIKKVQTWLKEKGLDNIKLVPLELFEIKKIIQNNI